MKAATDDWNPTKTVEITKEALRALMAEAGAPITSVRLKVPKRYIINFDEALGFPIIPSKFLAKV